MSGISISNGDFTFFFGENIFYLFSTEISSPDPSGAVTMSVSGCVGFLAILGYAGAARPSRICLVLVRRTFKTPVFSGGPW